MNRGLPKLSGGIAKREREAWEKRCSLPDCKALAAGIIDTVSGPRPICELHVPQAERMGYSVRRPS